MPKWLCLILLVGYSILAGVLVGIPSAGSWFLAVVTIPFVYYLVITILEE